MADIAGNSKVSIGDAAFTEIFRTFPAALDVAENSAGFKEELRGSQDAIDVMDTSNSQYIRNTMLGVTLSDTLEVSEFSSTASVDVVLSDGWLVPESDYVQVRLRLLNNGLNATEQIAGTSTIRLEHITALPNGDLDVFPIKTLSFDGAFSTPNEGDILFTFNKPNFKTNLRINASVDSPFGMAVAEMLTIVQQPSVSVPAIPQDFEQTYEDADWTEPDFAPGSPGPVLVPPVEFDFTPNLLDSDITYAGGNNRFVFNAGPPEALDFQEADTVLFNSIRLAEKQATNLFDNTLATIDGSHNPAGFLLSAPGLLISSTLEQNLTSKSNTYVATIRNTLIATGVDHLVTLESANFTNINAALDLTVSGWIGIEPLDDDSSVERTTVIIDYYNNVSVKLAPSTTKDLVLDSELLLQTFAVSETAVPAGTVKIKFRFEMTSVDAGDAIKFRLLLPQVVQLGQATSDILGIEQRNGDVWTIPQAGNMTPTGGTIAVTVIGGGAASVGTLFDTTDPATGQDGFKLTYDGTNLTFTIDDAGTSVSLVGADAAIPTTPTEYIVAWDQSSDTRRIWRGDTLIAGDNNTNYTVPTVLPTDIYVCSNANGVDQPNVVLANFAISRRATRGGVSSEAIFSDSMDTVDMGTAITNQERLATDEMDMTDTFSTV